MPASPSTARAINDRLALGLLQSEGPLTANQLKQLTGLSRPSVADLVERLQGSGLVAVVGEAGARRRGPNARLYGIVADRAHLAALDVRTDSVSVVVTDLLGAVLAEASAPIGGDTATAVESALALVEGAAREGGAQRLHTVGIGAPGLIDPATGDLHDTTSLPAWHRALVAPSRSGSARASWWRTRPTSPPAPNSGTAPRATGRRSCCSGSARGWERLSYSTACCAGALPAAPGRSVSCRCRARAPCRPPPAARAASTRWPAPRPSTCSAPCSASGRRAGPRPTWCGTRSRRVRTPSWTPSPTAWPSAPPRWPRSSTPGASCSAARWAARAPPRSPRVEQRVTAMSPLRTEVRASALGGSAVSRGALLARHGRGPGRTVRRRPGC